MIYLDHNATAPMRPEVADVMRELLPLPLNASSVHKFGREAKKYLEDARKTIADSVSAWPNEVVFCGSGTEANNWALRSVGRRVLVSAVEHSSILTNRHSREGGNPGTIKDGLDSRLRGNDVIKVNADGVIDLVALDKMLANGEPALVSIMLANNETGVIQPIAEVSELCKKHGALLHCDAVQGLGKIAVDFGALGVDMMTLSAHKCGGPLGAASLVVRRDLAVTPLLTGGGQELGRRAGTENIAAIAGFAKAVELADFAQMQKLRGWLGAMEKEMETAGGTVIGSGAARLPNTSCVAMPGVSNEVQLMNFDLKGFAVSAGSACSSGRIEISHVLAAMGLPPELAGSAIRVSGGWKTTQEDIISFIKEWKNIALRLRKQAKTVE